MERVSAASAEYKAYGLCVPLDTGIMEKGKLVGNPNKNKIVLLLGVPKKVGRANLDFDI